LLLGPIALQGEDLEKPDQVSPIRADAPGICIYGIAAPDAKFGIEQFLKRRPRIAPWHLGHWDRGLHTLVEILLSIFAIVIIEMKAANKVLVRAEANAKRPRHHFLEHREAEDVVR